MRKHIVLWIVFITLSFCVGAKSEAYPVSSLGLEYFHDLSPTGACAIESKIYVATNHKLFEHEYGDEYGDELPSKVLSLDYEVNGLGGSQVNTLGIPFFYRGELLLVDLSSGIVKSVTDGMISSTSPSLRMPTPDSDSPYDLIYRSAAS